jgi:hypothetical protein
VCYKTLTIIGTDLCLITATRSQIHATDNEIGAAELYHHEGVLRTSLGGVGVPPWLDAFVNTLNQIQQTVERIEERLEGMEDNQRHTSAAVENMRIAKSNYRLVETTGSTSFLAKQKEVRRV